MKKTSLWNGVQKISHDMLNSVVNKRASSKIQPSVLYPDFSILNILFGNICLKNNIATLF